ncbi:M48 family metalloprotease [Sphingomonas aliaeris]|uniref:M48 family metalloprotease n=1 Tax=Sphingomonas aliaeris TaxID=2759526 RepID=A0A974NWQ8_9SPHN|nr:M48 family metalloprotease [Sphingomonas aliaeris]QQV78454.1 M48 family metalloprotease [Sphingomonas aliaeris]
MRFQVSFLLLSSLTITSAIIPTALVAAPNLIADGAKDRPAHSSSATSLPDPYLEGRAEDARVARISYRLTTVGAKRCLMLEPNIGLVLQHLSQFEQKDRAEIIAALPLDRGPGVIAIVLGGPAAEAGIHPGDILLDVNGVPIPSEPGLSQPFDAGRAHRRNDTVTDLLEKARMITVLREGAARTLTIAPVPACLSRVHLARSGQRNAFADGRHVFLTTGILALLRNDHELAFFIAHEMAHNILGHAAAMRSGAVESRKAVRQIESTADLLAGNLMIDSGYDPVVGAAALKRVGAPISACDCSPSTSQPRRESLPCARSLNGDAPNDATQLLPDSRGPPRCDTGRYSRGVRPPYQAASSRYRR